MGFWPRPSSPTLVLGTSASGSSLFPKSLKLTDAQIATHKHIIGVSGVGKSKLLESIFLQLVRKGIGVSLIENLLPITAMHLLLTNKAFRDQLLTRVTDPDVIAFFQDRFDAWSRTETPQMIESTLRRLFLLTFSPTLKFSLGQQGNVLNF